MIVPDTPQTLAEVAAHYDQLDPVYRRIWGEHVHHGYWRTGRESPAEATEALTALVAARLEVQAGQSLCDIGCGYGASAELIASRHGARVTGLGISAVQIAMAQSRQPQSGSLHFLRRDWLDNGLPALAFDGAYAIESSEHMADKARFFSEAARVLRPGGRLVVCAWLASSRAKPIEIRYLLQPICREGRLPGMGSREDYEALAEAAGLEPIGYDDVSRKVRRTWSICARRLAGGLIIDSGLRRMALDKGNRDRAFLLSVPRLLLAMRIGAMRYGVFTWGKPTGARG